jgi:ABC-2 type transport system permease protein
MWPVFIRELKAYIQNIVGFIFMGLFLFLSGIFFTMMNLLQSSPDYISVLSTMTFIFLFAVPILTMRLLTEETRQKTDQLLLTSPLSLTGMVLGKYLAALAVFAIALAITVIYPLLLSLVGRLYAPEIVGGYVGFFLLGSAFIAVGLFVSSLTDNQVIAAFVTFGALLFMWILEWVQQGLPSDQTAGIVFAVLLVLGAAVFAYFATRNLYVPIAVLVAGGAVVLAVFLAQRSAFDGFVIKFFQWFSLLKRYEEFGRGILAVSPIVYYASFSTAFVFLTVRVIEKRRWQ